jgi:hypothetical protein
LLINGMLNMNFHLRYQNEPSNKSSYGMPNDQDRLGWDSRGG